MSFWILLAVTLLPDAPADRYEQPKVLFRVATDKVIEASGIVASRRNIGVFWIHNDSGDVPRLFAIDTAGRLVATLQLAGVKAIDWEDVAIGPRSEGGDPDQIYVADTGNNFRTRSELTIYRIPEPKIDLSRRGQKLRVARPELFRVRYADGKFDCEGMVVHPRRPEVYLFSKEPDCVGVYRFEADKPGAPTLSLPRIKRLGVRGVSTAASLSPDGSRLALRFYSGICEWQAPRGGDVLQHLGQKPGWLPSPVETKSEGLCYSVGSDALYTISEGSHPVVHLLKAKKREAAK